MFAFQAACLIPLAVQGSTAFITAGLPQSGAAAVAAGMISVRVQLSNCYIDPWRIPHRQHEARCSLRHSLFIDGTRVDNHRSGALSATCGGSDDIDLEKAMANARVNLAEGKSPGAGLDSAFDQADAAFADLIVTSVDDQGIDLDEEVTQDRTQVRSID